MDAAKQLRSTVEETVTMAVEFLFPKVRELVARQILSQFEEKFGLPQTLTLTKKKVRRKTKTKAKKAKPSKTKKAAPVAKTARRKHLTKKQMQCKHPSGCEERSKGPRYGYLCAGHQPRANTRPNLRVVPHSPSSKIKEKGARKAA